MGTPHKHAEIIKAWANGSEIEAKTHKDGPWIALKHTCQIGTVAWSDAWEYRIKPEPKPDVVFDLFVSPFIPTDQWFSFSANLRLTFDAETHQLKTQEALK